VAVARALTAAPGTLGLANQGFYLHISVAWRGVQDFTRRTWYPDPLTAALIVRLASGQLSGSKEGEDLRANNRLWLEILDALRSAGVDKADEPETLSAFFADSAGCFSVADAVSLGSVCGAWGPCSRLASQDA
jgi:hypothetical protein